MYLTMLKSKIHRATVTQADVSYVGSITVDKLLLDAAGVREYEQVHVADIDTGSRLVTYAIAAEPGSGTICINGAGAKLVGEGDKIIIMVYAQFSEEEADGLEPTVVFVDERNAQCAKEDSA